MTHIPMGQLGYENITTSEQLSGRLVDGAPSYVKLIKRAGATGTGALTFAHGITGITRVVFIRVGINDQVPQWFTIPIGLPSFAGAVFGLGASIDGTNIILDIGTSWAATNALEDCWAIVEYLK